MTSRIGAASVAAELGSHRVAQLRSSLDFLVRANRRSSRVGPPALHAVAARLRRAVSLVALWAQLLHDLLARRRERLAVGAFVVRRRRPRWARRSWRVVGSSVVGCAHALDNPEVPARVTYNMSLDRNGGTINKSEPTRTKHSLSSGLEGTCGQASQLRATGCRSRSRRSCGTGQDNHVAHAPCTQPACRAAVAPAAAAAAAAAAAQTPAASRTPICRTVDESQTSARS